MVRPPSVTTSPGEGAVLAPPVTLSGQLAFDLVVAAPDGSDPHRFPVGGTCYCVGWGGPDLDWAPDGSRLAIVAPYGLYTIRADGSDLRTLIGDRPGQIQVDGPPAWRPMP